MLGLGWYMLVIRIMLTRQNVNVVVSDNDV